MNQNSTFNSKNHKAASATHIAAIIGGSALAVYGLTRRSKSGAAMAAMGGALAVSNLRQNAAAATHPVHATFAINCTPQHAYRLWRNFENLPRFMRHLESVKVNGNESDWTAVGPGETKLHWRAEITEDEENQRIAWRSLPGAEVENRGWVKFRPGTAGRGTVVTVKMAYLPPLGPLGKVVAALTGRHPEFTVREDLRRFKALIEAGETPTIHGQTHGPRNIAAKAKSGMYREPQNNPMPQEHADLREIA